MEQPDNAAPTVATGPTKAWYARHPIWTTLIAVLLIAVLTSSIQKAQEDTSTIQNSPQTPQATASATTSAQTPVRTPKQASAMQTAPPKPSAQEPPRTANGDIRQLKIDASAEGRSVAFSSQEDYTNCNNNVTVIENGQNQQPLFTIYKDSGSINLFAGDAHSVAYGSLVDDNGNTLAADIIAGKFGGGTAGVWGLTCDQGQYSLKIGAIE